MSVLAQLKGLLSGKPKLLQDNKNIVALIESAAQRYALPRLLLAAVILQESGGNPWAYRYEEGFFRVYLKDKAPAELPGRFPLQVSRDSELHARSASWGLFQIMGNTARVHGFAEVELTKLLVPEINIDLGAKIIHHWFTRFQGRIEGTLLRWNGGGNMEYPAQVVARINNGQAARFLGDKV